MKSQKLMMLSLATVSLMMLPLLAWSPDSGDHIAMAQKAAVTNENKPLSNTANNIQVSFEAPKTVHANELTKIQMKVTDKDSGAPLTHVDWAISVKDPNGNIIYRTTTAHSHVGIMDFSTSFPIAGQSTVSLTASSIGLKMMGMDVPAMARTHTMLSGDPMEGWKTDPDNNFGTRTYEFPVSVLPAKQIKTVEGSERGTLLNVEMAADGDLIAGKPVTLIFSVTNAKDGSMVTHPDMLLRVRNGALVVANSAPSGGMMMPMNGAYHGHTGVMTYTTTFPRAGSYILTLDLNSLPVSNLIFGNAQTRFILDVVESEGKPNIVSTSSTPRPNTVNIVGMEAPFYAPNSVSIKSGTTLTFENVDGNMHTVTTVKKGTTEPDGNIDSGLIKAGESFTVKFDKPGTYEYFCAIHPGMKGTVIVS
jgi:plastocyanin